MLKRLQVSKILASGMLVTLATLLLSNASIQGLAQLSAMSPGQQQMQGEDAIATLPDGHYQLCSKPDPMDWRDGVGVCFNFKKSGQTIEGYYGYPNSDKFVCIRGTVTTNQIRGEGLALSWPGAVWYKIPDAELTWDAEGHLKMVQGKIVRSAGEGEDRIDWLRFHKVVLDVSRFYRYRSPKMTSPSVLCDWKNLD
jgi:hypothetical protein